MAFPPSYQFPQCTINATPFDSIALKALQRLRIQPTSTLCNARLTTYSLTRNLTFPIKLLTANFPIFFISTTFAPTPTLKPIETTDCRPGITTTPERFPSRNTVQPTSTRRPDSHPKPSHSPRDNHTPCSHQPTTTHRNLRCVHQVQVPHST